MFRLGGVIIRVLLNHIEVYEVTVHIWDSKGLKIIFVYN